MAETESGRSPPEKEDLAVEHVSSMPVDESLAGPFEIERMVASGGAGSVFRARDRRTGEPVALKLLEMDGETAQQRFRREMKLLASLSHPGIVRHVAHGTTAGGRAYLAMEWLEGETLAQRLRRETLTVDESLTLATRVADALAAAHARGVVHRDVKPSNLILVDGRVDRVKLVDFGLAIRAAGDERLTLSGSLLGTPGYMSPEQARGELQIDARTDVFALGSVLFQCLTGRPAFAGDDPLAVLLHVVLEEPPRVSDLRPDVPRELGDLVARMMAKARTERPADGEDVASRLQALGRMTGPAARRAPADATMDSTLGITTTEQSITCLVLASLPRGPHSPEEPRADALVPLRAVVGRRGGKLSLVADGSLLITLPSADAATDLAVQAARCAMAVEPLLPGARLVVVMGRRVQGAGAMAGEIAHRAARLLAEEAPGIFLDAGVAALVETRFDLVAEGEGMRLRGERESPDPARTLLGKSTPCVGRERELAILKREYDQCVEDSTARAVLVVAPPGFGKSRLRFEVQKMLQRRSEAPELWIGRGDSMNAGAPFEVLARAVRSAIKIREGEPAATRREKLRARLSARFDGRELERIATFLGELLGIPAAGSADVLLSAARRDPMLMGDQMRRAVEDLLRAETEVQPVVLLLEDLHWGDLPSLSAVDAALGALADRPLMVLGTARPEVHEHFPRLWQARSVTTLQLGPLGRKAAEKLVRHALGDGADVARVGQLVERAAGNAFFLEELIRASVQRAAGPPPASVLATVQARLSALDPEARRVLRAASVFGEVFWRGGVEALLGGEDTAFPVADWLRVLCDQEIIVRRVASRFPDAEELAFRHAMLHEGAYAMLLDGDRQRGHALAGEWLERAGEGSAVVLAEHFERGGESGRAAAFYRRAAGQALEANDLDATLAYARRAAGCGAEGPLLGEIRRIELEALRWLGALAEARRAGEEALALLPRGGAHWFGAMADAAAVAAAAGNVDALERAAEALVETPLLAEAREAGLSAAARVTVLLLKASSPLAERLFTWLDAQAGGTTPGPSLSARLHEATAWRALLAGDLGEGLSAFEAAKESFERAGDERNACAQAVSSAAVRMYLGGHAGAAAALRSAAEVAGRLGVRHVRAAALHNLGLALAHAAASGTDPTATLEEARKVEEEALAEVTTDGDRRLEAGSRLYLAMILLLQGDAPAAEREARAAEAAAIGPLRASALAVLAQVLLSQGRAEEALAVAAAALDRGGPAQDMEEGDALLRLCHAEALAGAGYAEAAREALEAAVHRLLERASKIKSAVWRRSFLEDVPENARTLALARRDGVTSLHLST